MALSRISLSVAFAIVGLLSGMPVGFFAARCLQLDKPAEMARLYRAPQMNKKLSDGAGVLVIDAFVDSNGRVIDYRILSSPLTGKELPRTVKSQLIFTMFRPATFNGTPTSGRVLLTFCDTKPFSTP